MRILFIGDGHSPTMRSWLEHWLSDGDEVHFISTYPCKQPVALSSFHIVPIGLSRLSTKGVSVRARQLLNPIRGALRVIRYFLVPASLYYKQRIINRIIADIQPDIIHALRIPFEGMLSFRAPKEIPVVVSTWGNDITLHGNASPIMTSLTRKVLGRANALISDTKRDIRLGFAWGLSIQTTYMVVPGSGGIRFNRVKKEASEALLPDELPAGPLVINSRGQRPGSLRQDLFFKAIPTVLKSIPNAKFICPSLANDVKSTKLVSSLGIKDSAILWPQLSQPQLWKLFTKAKVFVSPSIHDGIPNALLESMYFRCLPVVGNIESMREWIIDGVNGILINANDSDDIATGIIQALNKPALQIRAANINADLIAERVDYGQNMKKVRMLYQNLLHKRVF